MTFLNFFFCFQRGHRSFLQCRQVCCVLLINSPLKPAFIPSKYQPAWKKNSCASFTPLGKDIHQPPLHINHLPRRLAAEAAPLITSRSRAISFTSSSSASAGIITLSLVFPFTWITISTVSSAANSSSQTGQAWLCTEYSRPRRAQSSSAKCGQARARREDKVSAASAQAGGSRKDPFSPCPSGSKAPSRRRYRC